jgi:hypothetical protein
MARTSLLAYLSVPAFVALGSFVLALTQEPLSWPMLLAYVLGGFLFYAAPYFLWAIISTIGKFPGTEIHAGFIAACVALAAVLTLSFVARDASGLPIQWVLYWPLALLLQVAMAGVSALYRRGRSHVDA